MRERLHREFPDLQIIAAHDHVRAAGRSVRRRSVIIVVRPRHNRRHHRAACATSKWIQSLATGVDHFLRCPSLQAGRPDHQRARHSRPADARGRASIMMMAIEPRRRRARSSDNKTHFWDAASWNLLSGKTAAVVGIGVVGDRHRRSAQGLRHARDRRHAHAARDRGLRRDDPDGPADRGRGARPTT